MVGKKTLKEYGFETVEEYYSMVYESKINGNFEQAKKQFKQLSKVDRVNFLQWLEVETGIGSNYNWFLSLLGGLF